MDQPAETVSWTKFFVFMMGPTKGAHRDIVSKLKSSGQTEVSSPEESDYLLVFCSIMLEIEMYISEFLENISDGKPIILVVMHHTDNPDQVVAPSRRQVDNPNICLTVDCLLCEGRFLQCDCNNSAWADIQKHLGVSTSLDPTLTDYIHLTGTKFFVFMMGPTQGAHRDIVSKLKARGQTGVSSPEESDYLLVFCSIMSEDEMSISDFLENLSVFTGGKPIILVVMHHTDNPDQVVAPSRRQVDNPNVCLTVDYLFYEGKPLKCSCNDSAWVDIQKSLGVSTSQVPVLKDISNWTKFFVLVMGETKGAHRDIVSKLTSTGQTEVSSPEESDYLLVFCSIMSEVEMYISYFLENFSGGKPIILVVMHHAINRDEVDAPSRRQVDNLNVYLSVDCLCYEGKLLQCNNNDIAWADIQKSLGVSTPQVPVLCDISNMSVTKFFVTVLGKTNGAHEDIVSKLKSCGQTVVSSPEESDYLLVFCPITSRVGTDVSDALENTPGGKPIILVVMHHTFNRDQIVAPSRRQVDNPNVCLTVDCLFYEGKLLQCKHNDIAWVDIQKSLGVSTSPKVTTNLFWKKFFVIVSGRTKGAHQELVSKLKSSGQTEALSPEDSDYLLVFCPITARVGTAASDALENIPGGKPVILVVMHHTFNRDQIVAPSRRQVDNPNVHLTVDCLFYGDKLLQCKPNDNAWVEIQKVLGIIQASNDSSYWIWSAFKTRK